MKRSLAILAVIATVFFVLTWTMGAPYGGLYNSPDETANAFWAARLAAGLPLEVRDEAVEAGLGSVHPRSMAVVGDRLVPGSFPGIIILYGAIHLVTRLPFEAMTPLLTAISGLLLYGVIRKIFNERVGFWSAVLFYIHPAVIYYTGRGLFHNVLLVDLLIASAALLLLTRSRFAGGLLFGLAIVTRATALIWTLPLSIGLIVAHDRSRWKKWMPAIFGALLPILLWGGFNARVYGSPLQTGYGAPVAATTSSPATEVPATAPADSPPDSAIQNILPFGFHPRNILNHGYDYGLRIFWWFSLAAIGGLAITLRRWKTLKEEQRAYAIITLMAGAWLAIFYGSWYIRDNADPTLVTIGTSYVRYFLPVYVLTLPWVALGLIWIAERSRHRNFIIAAAMLFAVLGVRASINDGEESLSAIRATLKGNAAKKQVLLAAIPEETVVMTARFDKIIFPERVRVIPLGDDGSWRALGRLAEDFPVAWYGIEPSKEEWAMIQTKSDEAGLEVVSATNPVPGELLVTFKPKL